jgi:HK97 family phage prohead protease
VTDPPIGQLRYRTISEFAVDYPARMIELIVTPYETEALVQIPGRGLVTEIFSAGAYSGIERRANRIRVNRDHDVTRTVGRAIALHPSRSEGLVAEIRIAKTTLGDETLALADEGILDASAGYLPMADGELWETRNRVRVTKAWLGHIAMTPDPAYQSANVLAVRHNSPDQVAAEAQTSTPNLDQVREMLQQDRLRALEAGLHPSR